LGRVEGLEQRLALHTQPLLPLQDRVEVVVLVVAQVVAMPLPPLASVGLLLAVWDFPVDHLTQ